MAVEQAYGFKSFNLIAEENSLISGIFPITMLKTPLKRPELVALPYCDVGTILAKSLEAKAELLNEAIVIAKSNNASVLDIRGQINHDLLHGHDYSVQTVGNKVRMLLDLPHSSEGLWDGFKSKLRSQIRKAEKNGLVFQFSERVDDFYPVFSENMRDLGSPVHSKKWIKSVIKFFDKQAKIGIVQFDQKIVGVGIILSAGKTVSIPWASTSREYNRLGPNMLLYWNFLRYAADNGYATFDFGRSTLNEGTFRFKSQWGAKPYPLKWHHIILQGQKEVSGNYNENSAK
ncbi:MAG: GNAT family N-acetyltransferase, partial [Deltaproteobacteria bacterium]|nr:GNAT family N-acetyltransferase [Candidatus Desulfobacula maris]